MKKIVLSLYRCLGKDGVDENNKLIKYRKVIVQ